MGVFKDSYDIGKNRHEIWYLESERIRYSANILYENYLKKASHIFSKHGFKNILSISRDLETIKVITLLFGLSMELILKSLIIKKGKRKEGEKMWNSNGHNLVVLSDQAAFKMDIKTRELFEKLTIYVMWRGRYPIQNEYEESDYKKLPFDKIDKKTFDENYEKILNLLEVHWTN